MDLSVFHYANAIVSAPVNTSAITINMVNPFFEYLYPERMKQAFDFQTMKTLLLIIRTDNTYSCSDLWQKVLSYAIYSLIIFFKILSMVRGFLFRFYLQCEPNVRLHQIYFC